MSVGSVSYKTTELTQAVHAALREAACLTYGSMVFPYNSDVVWPERRAARTAAPLQWALERDTFETEVVKQYASMAAGEVRELIAGTGVGKSTRMPYCLSQAHGVNGLLLAPNHTLPLHNVTYLTKAFAEMGGEVSVTELRSKHLLIPMQTPCVYYASAATFLGRLATHPKLLQQLQIAYVYLDESHSITPDYKFFPYLLQTGCLEGIKVFYGTATGKGSMNMESGGVGRKVKAVSEKDMSVSSTTAVTERSPLHYTRVNSRTVIHLANDKEITNWGNYYDQHDIPVFMCKMANGTSPIPRIVDYLNTYPLCAVLVYGNMRYGYTHNADTSICSGYESIVVTDFRAADVSVQRVPVTQSMRVQTMGRVGRFKPGEGYYADVDTRSEEQDMSDDVAFYVYLWAIVFNIRINDPRISSYSDVTGELSTKAAAILLHSRLPPALLLPYLGNDGFYGRWANIADYVLYTKIGSCQDVADVNTSSWTVHHTGPVDYSTASIEYRSLIKFPKQWEVIAAYAWSLHQGASNTFPGMRARSVISAAPSVVTRVDPRASRFSVDTYASHTTKKPASRAPSVERPVTPLRRQSVATRATTADIMLGVPRFDTVKSIYSARDTMPPVHDVAMRPVIDPMSSLTRRDIESWHASVTRITPPTSPKMNRVGSEASDDRDKMRLKQVDPVKYKYCKLYPMDALYFERLMDSETFTSEDRSHLNSLLTGRKNIVSLDHDRQGEFFLSVIRLHNHSVALRAQLAANVRTTFMERVVIAVAGDKSRADEDVIESAKMLAAFQLQSWYVGVDRRSLRSSEGELLTPDYDYDETRARVMMSLGDANVVTLITNILRHSVPLHIGGKYVCNAWSFNDKVLTVSHAFENVSDIMYPMALSLVHDSDEHDFAIFQASGTLPYSFRFRDPVAPREEVYLLAYDAVGARMMVLGDYMLVAGNDIALLHGSIEKGGSGALVVAVSDGCIVGMYVSYYGESRGTPISNVLPASKFMGFL